MSKIVYLHLNFATFRLSDIQTFDIQTFRLSDIQTIYKQMKKYTYLTITVVALLFLSCGHRDQQHRSQSQHVLSEETISLSEAQQHFFDKLSGLCGNSYIGEQVYRSHHGSSWAHLDLLMHVSTCKPDSIFIPFHVGTDRSRTWLFIIEDGRLRFRHDHRHEDGTPEAETLYGGYADDHGTAFVQYFPADDYSATLIEDGGGNVWTVKISEDFSTFTYRLDRDGEKRFQIDFDLNKPQ